jgi:hypothetical protein
MVLNAQATLWFQDSTFSWQFCISEKEKLGVNFTSKTSHRVDVCCFSLTRRISVLLSNSDRLWGLVVTVPGYRSRGPSSIPGAIRFSEKYWVRNGIHSASWVQLRSYLEEKLAAPVQKIENTAVGEPPRLLCDTLLSAKVDTNFVDKRR